MIYCGDRNYNYILAIFWGIIALIWLWDLITNYTPFERYHKYDKLTYILYAMPFLYPLLSWARGMEFPMMTTCVMPCSVAVFTIGLLLAFSRKVNLLVILFLCHWALIAFSKVYIYKFPKIYCWQVQPFLPFISSSRITSTRICIKKQNQVPNIPTGF